MNGHTLGALRQFLHYSVPEAARLLAASEQRPQGVQERTWRHWESERVPVPLDMAERVREVLDWRADALGTAVKVLREQLAGLEADATIELWLPASAEVYVASGAEAWQWRPYCSIVAELAAMDTRIELVADSGSAEQIAKKARLSRN